MITVHILLANGSVVDTRTSKTLGNLVAYNEECITLVDQNGVTEYDVTDITSVTKHGVVATVEKTVTNSFEQVARNWAEDNAVWSYVDAPDEQAHHNH
jgi:hypothetical protein